MAKDKDTVVRVLDIIVEAIAEAGPEGIPSGEMYAMLCDRISLETWLTILAILQQAGKIKVRNHVITAI